MSFLRRWAPLLLGLLVAGLAAFGYTQLAPRIADQSATLRGMVRQPPAGDAFAALLDDGRPVFVANSDEGGLAVFDGQSSHAPSGMGHLLAWCPTDGHFEDLFGGSTFGMNGTKIDGPAPTGLLSYGLQALPDRTDLIGVTSATFRVDQPAGRDRPPAGGGCTVPWIVHEPDLDEVFDPSVAVDQEPEGWIWLDGALTLMDDGSVLLCDGQAIECATFAELPGIDRAYFSVGPARLPGIYIGRVRDGAIEGLIAVPNP